MGRINDVLIVANRNYVPVDFIVLDIDCNPTSWGLFRRSAGGGFDHGGLVHQHLSLSDDV